jgi:predicted NACHT family NTPase
MWDFIFDFEYLAEGLCWYLLDAFDLVAEEVLAFCLVFASLAEEFIGFFFCQILIA